MTAMAEGKVGFFVSGRSLRDALSLLKSCDIGDSVYYFEYDAGNVAISKYSKNNYILLRLDSVLPSEGRYSFPIPESCFSFINKFKKVDFCFEMLERGCFISPAGSGTKLRIDFEDIEKTSPPQYLGVTWHECKASSLLDGLTFLSGMRSTKEDSNFSGIEFFSNKLISTNGFIAGEYEISYELPNFVLSDLGCKVLNNILDSSFSADTIKIGLVEKSVVFDTGSIKFFTAARTEEKELRPIKMISDIMRKCKESCFLPLKVSVSAFMDKWLLFKTKKKGKIISFSLKNNLLIIQDTADGYDLKSEVECSWAGPDREFKMDAGIVNLFLSKMTEEDICLNLSESLAAPMFFDFEKKKILLQPIR